VFTCTASVHVVIVRAILELQSTFMLFSYHVCSNNMVVVLILLQLEKQIIAAGGQLPFVEC